MNSYKIDKEIGINNPIIAQRFMADPYAIEYDGRVYVYGSNDSDSFYKDENGLYDKNRYANIKSINCVSSCDLVNWTDHGIIQVADDSKTEKNGVAKWSGNSWAPAVCYKYFKNGETEEMKAKFFLYFANSATSIGVLTADSPTGPWNDPIGKPMITKETPGCEEVEWLFDPAVLVDDDGNAYIYFGGGVPTGKEKNPQTARVAKLTNDMTAIDGEAMMIDAPLMFEDSGINKINGKYYYSYCINWSEEAGQTVGKAQIAYMVSDNPMGPFEYKGIIMKNPGQSDNFSEEAWGNNHHCMLQIKDKIYMFYHSPQYQLDRKLNFNQTANDGNAYRTTYVDIAVVNSDGSVVVENMTKKGTLSAISHVDPYINNEGATFVWGNGVTTEWSSEGSGLFAVNVGLQFGVNDGWIGLSGVDFGTEGANGLVIKAAALKQCRIKVFIDKCDTENLIADLFIAPTGSLSAFADNMGQTLHHVKGIHDIFICSEDVSLDKQVMVALWRFVS